MGREGPVLAKRNDKTGPAAETRDICGPAVKTVLASTLSSLSTLLIRQANSFA
jgi:hypothetical protein